MFRICSIVSAAPRGRLGERAANVADEEPALPDAAEDLAACTGDVPEELDPRPLHDGVGLGGTVLVVGAVRHGEAGTGTECTEPVERCCRYDQLDPFPFPFPVTFALAPASPAR